MTRLAILPLLAALALPLPGRADPIHDSELNFTFAPPTGFVQEEKASPGTLYRFGKRFSDHASMILGVARLKFLLGREPPKIAPMVSAGEVPQFPKGARQTLETIHWQEFDIPVVRMEANDADVITLAAQVPLKPEAIQVMVASNHAHEAESRTSLNEVLSSLRGNSNWTDAPPPEKPRGVMRILLGVIAATIVSVAAFLLFRQRSARTAN